MSFLTPRPDQDDSFSLFNWSPTSVFKAISAELKVLTKELTFTNETNKKQAHIGYVPIKKTDYINTLYIPNNSDRNIVIAHGYGAGLGFFSRNYADIAKSGYNVYALDWIGMANSSRPNFPCWKDDEVVDKIEEYFVDVLEEWREKVGIEKFVLMGHSLGGYLSSVYSLKHPSRVEKLLLVSPEQPEEYKVPKTFGQRLFYFLWGRFSPLSIIRVAGPWGPNLTRGYTERRFSDLPEFEREEFRDYIYHISAQRGSAEIVVPRLFEPGVWGKKALVNRLHELKMPTTFVYGDVDWMKHEHALKVAPKMSSAKVVVVENAGHHVYIDNKNDFNNLILSELSSRGNLSTARYVFDNTNQI